MASLVLAAACAKSGDAVLDEAKFLIDRQEYEAATIKLDAAILEADSGGTVATDADAVELRRLASSAYFGLSKLTILDIASDVSSFPDDGDENDFLQFACLVDTLDVSRFDSIQTSIKRLTDLGAAALAEETNKSVSFQAGITELVEAFGLPPRKGSTANTAGLVEGASITPCAKSTFTLTIASMTEADKNKVLNDFVNADDHFRNAGIKETDAIMKALRENYCRLKVQDPSPGFRLVDLQAQIVCQLSDTNPATIVTGAPPCADFTSAGTKAAAITTCLAQDNTQL
ncbi:MAG: hypothetical protein Q7S98_03710 [Deltaproteobacteria bacterium]|nr:hypothetical protein [Deltaproteobacteria bacterium]